MRGIMVMYDSLNRALLESYGCDWTRTPNFKRLAERSTQFENCYVGSMPCMPARRELHTGRPNFLHRSWGPLEPFDDSMPEILRNAGICSHLVSDHQHYWEDGGGTYHTRYTSWECIRGQEGDPWKENLCFDICKKSVFKGKEAYLDKSPMLKAMNTHDQVNRTYMNTEEKTPQALTFEAGLEYIDTNYPADNWFLQIECFDPHEPFFCDEKYKKHFDGPLHGEDALGSDWPPYMPVQESEAVVQTVRNNYAALLEKCDASLGKVLDRMDRYNLWKDTMLIVCTDHGFLLGEHNWWGKTAMTYPDFYAAAVPVCEAVLTELVTEEEIEAMKQVPTWFVHCRGDFVVDPDKTVVPLYHRLKEAGAKEVHFTYLDQIEDASGLFRNPDGTPYRYIPHFAWVPVYNNACKTDCDGTPVVKNGFQVGIFQWLRQTRRAQR